MILNLWCEDELYGTCEIVRTGQFECEVTQNFPIVKRSEDDVEFFLTKYEAYDFQSFVGVVEKFEDGYTKLYLIDDEQVYLHWEMGYGEDNNVKLRELKNYDEYKEILQKKVLT